MEATVSYETSVTSFHTTRHHISKPNNMRHLKELEELHVNRLPKIVANGYHGYELSNAKRWS